MRRSFRICMRRKAESPFELNRRNTDFPDNDSVIVIITSLIEQIDNEGVGPRQKSIIDRCIPMAYQEAAETGIVTT